MLETMYKAPGIGLAAIQIGIPKRIVVIDISKDDNKKETKNMGDYMESSTSLGSSIDELNKKMEATQEDVRENHLTLLNKIHQTLKKTQQKSRSGIKRFFNI